MDDNHKAKLREALRAYRESGAKPEYLDPLQKAAANPASLRKAINAKCFDCVGRDDDPNWKRRVAGCEITGCPLWNVRQFKNEAEGKEDDNDD